MPRYPTVRGAAECTVSEGRTMENPFHGQLILGHRGSPLKALENTLHSFAMAVECGADGVELDVQRTRDGRAAVIHDETLDRTMGVKGRLARLHWGGIERLTGARVPSLQQVLAWAVASGAWLNVEIKSRGVESVVIDEIQVTGLSGRVVISSFDSEVIRNVAKLGPDLHRFLLTKRWDGGAIDQVSNSGASGICLQIDAATDATLEELRKRRLPVIAWTVNDAGAVRRLLEAGVAAIITDDPEMAAEVRSRLLADRPVA